MKTTSDPLSRFMKRVFKLSNGCWCWIGCRNNDGYESFRLEGKTILCHRWIYEYFNESLNDYYCMHKCNNPSCVNPEHLEKGTQFDNMKHCVNSGNNPRLNKTHCPKNHEYNFINTRIYKTARVCRVCDNLRRKN